MKTGMPSPPGCCQGGTKRNGAFADALSAGHVEKTNDRDYEVEERCEFNPKERKWPGTLENLWG